MAIRRHTFRLYPNKTQEKELFAARRLHCYLFNACIAHRRFEWKKNQKTVDYFQQQNCLPAFKKEWSEFAQLHSQALQATVKRVDLAYKCLCKINYLLFNSSIPHSLFPIPYSLSQLCNLFCTTT